MRRAAPQRVSRWSSKIMVYCVVVMAATIITQSTQTTAFSPSSLKPKVLTHATSKPLLKRNVRPLRALKSPSLFDELKEEMEEPLIDELKESNDLREQLVELPVMFTGEKDGQTFDMERWNTHRSSSRYIRLLFGVFFSVTTTRILPTVLTVVTWSAGIDMYNSCEHIYGLPELELPLTPFELTAPILGLLLVFRTDRAFDRFNLGSDYSWEITNLFKSIIREIFSFTADPRYWPEERAAAYDLVEACVQLHSWIMMDHLRGKQISSAKQAKFLQLALGSSAATQTGESIDTPLTPSAGVAAISLGMRRLPSLDFQESTLIESQFSDVVSSLGKCEMMLRTPIPLGYTRYSVRFLWIWLSLLPFALVNKFAEFGVNTWWEDKPQPVLVFAMLFIGFIFFSIEDIAVQIEEPFSVLPLELHNKWLRQDAKQIETMNNIADRIQDEQQQDAKQIETMNQLADGMQDEQQIVEGITKWQRTKSFCKRLKI